MSINLQDKHVLVTREKDQAQSFSRLITEAGGQPIVVPLLDITCLAQERHEKLQQPFDRFEWLFFTSANGVECFFEKLDHASDTVAACRMAVVGTKTEQALKKYGYVATFIPTTYNADTMASEFIEKHPDAKRLLLVRGNRSRPVLPDEFARHGYDIETLEVYETTVNRNARVALQTVLSQNKLDFITFTSPSTVKAFAELVDVQKYLHLVCVCIGTTTQKAVLEQGFKQTVVPDEFTIEGMVEQMSHYVTMKG